MGRQKAFDSLPAGLHGFRSAKAVPFPGIEMILVGDLPRAEGRHVGLALSQGRGPVFSVLEKDQGRRDSIRLIEGRTLPGTLRLPGQWPIRVSG